MEIQSILIGIAVLVLFMGPIIYIILQASAVERKNKKTIVTLCKAQGITIKDLERIGNTILGLDITQEYLIVSEAFHPKESLQVYSLKKIRTCTVSGLRSSRKTLDTVGMELSGIDFVKNILVYQEDDELNTENSEACLQRLMHWEQVVKKRLTAA